MWIRDPLVLGISMWRCIGVLLSIAALTSSARASSAFVESFNGPGTKWQLLQGPSPAQVVAQEIVRDGARDQNGAERLVAAASVGHSAAVAYACPALPVLDEFSARLWIKANRPGVQLAVRVVMPRTVDPRTNAPATAIVRSSNPAYDRPGHWRQLALVDLPKLLAAEVRIMRTLPGANIDSREAYVDAVVLIVPGHPQGTEVIADDLELDGILSAIEPKAQDGAMATVRAPNGAQADPRDLNATIGSHARRVEPTIEIVGSTLHVEGRMFLPRAITWNGEPLKFLAERGFNTIHVSGLPTVEHSSEAARHKLWFVCTPPGPETIARGGLAGSTERVLAWYLDDDDVQRDPDYFRRWAELVRAHDRALARPIVIAPLAQWEAMSKTAEIIVAGHPLAVRMTRDEFARWLDERKSLTRPGSIFWASIPTQLASASIRQLTTLSPSASPLANVDDSQVESLAHIAAMSCARGYILESHTSLSADDAATKHRSALVESVNTQLQQWEPWLAGGKVIGRISPSSNDAAGSGSATLMQVDHARLLVPEPQSPRSAGNRIFIIPGIPDSNHVYLFSPASMRPLDAERVAGGTSVVLRPDDEGWILVTEDPQVTHALRRQIAGNADRAARVRRELVATHLAELAELDHQLASHGISTRDAQPLHASARAALHQTDQLLAQSRAEEAYGAAGVALHALRAIAREQLEAFSDPPAISNSALTLSHGLLAKRAELMGSLVHLRGGENKLYGGDFEDLGRLMKAGWQHVNHPLSGIEARAELSSATPQHGDYCLQLSATSSFSPEINDPPAQPFSPIRPLVPAVNAAFHDPFQRAPDAVSPRNEPTVVDANSPLAESAVEVVPAPPVWITSPPMPVEAGQVLEITGWVRVPKPIAGSVDGLRIVDTLGGEELAVTIREASDWQSFRMIRAVPEPTELRITFMLCGVGSAQIDSVMVRPLAKPIARRLPAVASATPPPIQAPPTVEVDSPAQLYVTPQP